MNNGQTPKHAPCQERKEEVPRGVGGLDGTGDLTS